jgi:hypothetical protein
MRDLAGQALPDPALTPSPPLTSLVYHSQLLPAACLESFTTSLLVYKSTLFLPYSQQF